MTDGKKVAADAPEIPDRLFFRIGDVSGLAGVETHVLRFWESKFPTLSPQKTSNGQRRYRRKDVQTVLEIKRLLYDEGYTIAGARKALRERIGKKPKALPAPRQENLLAAGKKIDADALTEIKKELRAILDLLPDGSADKNATTPER